MFVSFLLTSLSLFLLGPSQLFGMSTSLWIVLLGYGVNGMAQGFIYIPLLPEIIESVQH